MKFKSPDVKVSIQSFLHKRNATGLGTELGKIGDVWKGNKTGQMYRDSFYYVEPNFGWLKGIEGSEKIQSKVSGVGWKVITNNGDPIVAGKEGITWKDLRENPSWVVANQTDLKKEKSIKIRRAPYYEVKNTDGSTQTIDLSENTCIVNVGSTSTEGGVYAYLVIGFAQGKAKKESGNEYRLSWENVGNNFLISGYGCDNLKGWFNGDVNLGVDWSWNDGGGKWTAREDSMVVLKRDEEIINLTGVSGDAVVPIVLGLVLDKVTVVQPNRPRGWTYNSLTNWMETSGEGGAW